MSPMRSWTEIGEVRVCLLHRYGVVCRDPRELEVIGSGIDQHHGEPQLAEASCSGRAARPASEYWPPAKIIPET
jgi:hypothetical protein